MPLRRSVRFLASGVPLRRGSLVHSYSTITEHPFLVCFGTSLTACLWYSVVGLFASKYTIHYFLWLWNAPWGMGFYCRAMRDRYVKVAPEEEDGFAQYLRTDVSFAAQMPAPFTIDAMRGKAGDYLVLNEGGGWPVDRKIVGRTYQLVEEQKE